LSRESAAALYRCFLLDKIAQVRAVAGASPAIAYAPATSRPLFEALAPGFLLVEQQGGDLGARLHGCFQALLNAGFGGVVAVDGDTPTLPTAYLEEAVRQVAGPGPDVVLGPSEDGGYYLIGLRATRPGLFAGMIWSTPTVLAETLARARAEGLRATCLAPWFDVDTPRDLERLRTALSAESGDTPCHTRRFLAQLRWSSSNSPSSLASAPAPRGQRRGREDRGRR
jgi:rSAM/selenodomain-associated transferase 1